MSSAIELYVGEVVSLLAAAGIPRSAIDLQDARYSIPDKDWFLGEGITAYRAQAVAPFAESWDCDNIACDFRLFFCKCHAQSKIATGATVFQLRYMPQIYPWGVPNANWDQHVNNVAILGQREVVFLEPQLKGSMIYEPTPMDIGTIDRCGD